MHEPCPQRDRWELEKLTVDFATQRTEPVEGSLRQSLAVEPTAIIRSASCDVERVSFFRQMDRDLFHDSIDRNIQFIGRLRIKIE